MSGTSLSVKTYKSISETSTGSSKDEASRQFRGSRIKLYSEQGERSLSSIVIPKKDLAIKTQTVKPGDILPYGTRLYSEEIENMIRTKEVGENKRIVYVGVIGSFTPDCWNRHLYQVIKFYDYFQERGVHQICCISTNDPSVQYEWGRFLGILDKVSMLSDVSAKLTMQIGMDIVVPWLDNRIRSRRYVILVDDMEVKKIIVAPDSADVKWDCGHLMENIFDEVNK